MDPRLAPIIDPRNRVLRAADRDRDAVAELLRRAHLLGRLDDEEFEERYGRCLTAKHYGELDRLIADLPLGARPAQPRETQSRGWLSPVAIATLLVIALMWLIALVGARHTQVLVFPRGPASAQSGPPPPPGGGTP